MSLISPHTPRNAQNPRGRDRQGCLRLSLAPGLGPLTPSPWGRRLALVGVWIPERTPESAKVWMMTTKNKHLKPGRAQPSWLEGPQ